MVPCEVRTATTLSEPNSTATKSPGFGIEFTWQTICQLGFRIRSYSRRVISG